MKHLEEDVIQQESINERNIALLRENFPGVIEENIDGSFSVNARKLQLLIDPKNATIEEDGFELSWVGKKEAYHTAFARNTKILKPLKDESKDFDTTENILIKGDNLDALRILKNNYFEAIKMIYIDPPYNTKSENFVYRDNFTKSIQETMEELGYDAENIDYIKNIQGARTHSGWLSFMYPRLLLARDLLKDDGVIFISIDDNEQANLKVLCDEVFGETNFIASVSVINNIAGRSDKKHIATAHEYILIYQKSSAFKSTGLPLTETQLQEYRYKDSNDKLYRLQGLRKRGSGARREDRPNMFYPVYYNEETNQLSLNPEQFDSYIEIVPKLSNGNDGRWRWGRPTFLKRIGDLEVRKVERRDEYDLYEKVYLENGDDDGKSTKMKSYLLDSDYTTDIATSEFSDLMESNVFNNPKPIQLLKDLLTIANDKNCIVLDFFAGSGTTGHAVIEKNIEDDGNRKAILVQWAEPINQDKQKAAHKFVVETLKKEQATIFEITAERLRRAGESIKLDYEHKDNIQKLDIGFRVFEVIEDERQAIYKKNLAEATQEDLDLFTNPRMEDIDTILYNLLVAEKLPLSSKIETLKENALYIAHNVAFIVGDIELEEAYALLEARKGVEYITIYSPLVRNDKFTLEAVNEFARLGLSSDKMRFRG